MVDSQEYMLDAKGTRLKKINNSFIIYFFLGKYRVQKQN